MLLWKEDQYNATLFESQLIKFRQWLKKNDYQDKPVIVSEFTIMEGAAGYQTAVPFLFQQVMPWMLSYTDPDIGYPYDGYHLVQQWVYFQLNWDSPSDLGDWPLLWPNGSLTEVGAAWVSYVATPANGYIGSPCGYNLTPQAYGPGANGYYTDQGDGDGGAQSPNNAGTDTPTPDPYPPPDSPAYP